MHGGSSAETGVVQKTEQLPPTFRLFHAQLSACRTSELEPWLEPRSRGVAGRVQYDVDHCGFDSCLCLISLRTLCISDLNDFIALRRST